MSKFSGMVGFVETEETAPGVYTEVSTEKHYKGDILRNTKQMQTGEHLNDDMTVSNLISIIANPYINNNLKSIRYVVWLGTRWKIRNIDVQSPRLILTIGGVYNGI